MSIIRGLKRREKIKHVRVVRKYIYIVYTKVCCICPYIRMSNKYDSMEFMKCFQTVRASIRSAKFPNVFVTRDS